MGDLAKMFIKMCDSLYGSTTCIYRFVNVNQIVEVHITHTDREINVEAVLTNGQRMLFLKKEDLERVVGTIYSNEIMEAIKELTNENRT